MTIKTLEFIHNLLVGEEAKTKRVYEDARRMRREYEGDDEAVNRELMEDQKAAADEHVSALNALEDFESHEWR